MVFLRIIPFFLCLLPVWAGAGTYDLAAHVSKDHLELGESFTLTLVLDQDGNLTFGPQLELPHFDGFQVMSGPRQSQQINWINGVTKTRMALEWDLAPLRSGKLVLGPFKAAAKDAEAGETVKTAAAISIHVAKGTGPLLPPTPTPEEDAPVDTGSLRDIKPDLGPPWLVIGALGLLGLALALLVAWLLLRKPKPKPVVAIRDPAQQALQDLEKARALLDRGDEAAYFRELARVIRFYLRHRSRQPEKELTLLEAERLMLGILPKGKAAWQEPIERLQMLLFAKEVPQAQDAVQLPQDLRQAILEMEKNGDWSPFQPQIIQPSTRGKRHGKRNKKTER